MSSKVKINKFWINFQKFLGATLPELLLKTLISAGYDNALALTKLDENDIGILEAHAESKLKWLIEKSDLYDENEPFVFLLGHKKTILNLSEKVNQFLDEKKRTTSLEEVELLTEEEIVKIKEKLVEKLNSTCKSKSEFGEQSIVSPLEPYISRNARQSRKVAAYKCYVLCVHCKKTIPTTYNGRWEISNIDRHIKSHIKKNPELAQSAAQNGNPTQTTPNGLQVTSHTSYTESDATSTSSASENIAGNKAADKSSMRTQNLESSIEVHVHGNMAEINKLLEIE